MCARMAAASAARSSGECTAPASATESAMRPEPANRTAPRMNDRREAMEIRRIMVVTSQSQVLIAQWYRRRTLSRGMLSDNYEYVSGAFDDANGRQTYGRTRRSCLQAPPAILFGHGANLSTSSTMDAGFGRMDFARRIRRR